MIPLRCRGLFNASAASRFPLRFNVLRKNMKKRRRLPVAVPFLLLICLAVTSFFEQPVVVFAQDRAVVTRVQEYFPPTESSPEFEVYYPQISFGGNPNQLQTANAMMREYALQRCFLCRQAVSSNSLALPPEAKVVDYQIMRNSGGFFSVVFSESPSQNSSLANLPPHGFTIQLSDQKICRLADLFLSNTNYTSLLDQEISRMLQRPFEGLSFDSSFYLTDDSIVLLPVNGVNEENWPGMEPISVPLTAPAVSRKLTIGLSIGHTRTDSFGGFSGKNEKSEVSPEDIQMDVQEEQSAEID